MFDKLSAIAYGIFILGIFGFFIFVFIKYIKLFLGLFAILAALTLILYCIYHSISDKEKAREIIVAIIVFLHIAALICSFIFGDGSRMEPDLFYKAPFGRKY